METDGDESDVPKEKKVIINASEEDDDEEEEDQEEYVVEKIVDKRKRGTRVEYLIKWKDWPDEDNTWEPEEHLSCPDLVKEFEEQLRKKAEKKRLGNREKERERAERFKKLAKEKEKARERERERDHDLDKLKDKYREKDRIREKEKEKSRDKDKDKLKNRDRDGDKSNRKRKIRVMDSSSGTPSPACIDNENSSNKFFPSDNDISSGDDEDSKMEKRIKSLNNKSSMKENKVKYEFHSKNESSDDMEDDNEEEDEVTGFDRGLEPKKIIGAISIEDKLMFLVRWESCKKCDLVLAEEANEKCPQVVISYYEKRLKWVPDFNNDLCD